MLKIRNAQGDVLAQMSETGEFTVSDKLKDMTEPEILDAIEEKKVTRRRRKKKEPEATVAEPEVEDAEAPVEGGEE